MDTAVTIDAYQHDLRLFFVIEQEDYDLCEKTFYKKDEGLIKFCENIDEKYEKWADVHPTHIKLMIIQLLDEEIDNNIQSNIDAYTRMKFFVCTLALKLSLLSGDSIDYIRIQYLGPSKANFQAFFDVTISVEFRELEKKPKLTIVVDNSKIQK